MPEGLRDNSAVSRFELELDGGLAFISYRRVGPTLWLNHAEVPAALGGRGLGTALVRQALDLIRSRGERMVPGCSFVAWFVRQHPEYADLCEDHGTRAAGAVSGTGVEIAPALLSFINDEALPGTGITPQHFWQGLAALLKELAPVNRGLLARRDELQRRIDAWHGAQPGRDGLGAAYEAMLRDIGYLVPVGAPFSIATTHVDPEIATIAGPQLVVPVSNARYALNAANARWGSLYDALYGTDVLPESEGSARGEGYNPQRGAHVVAYGREFLDRYFPLSAASHRDATAYRVAGRVLAVATAEGVQGLADPAAFVGFQGAPTSPSAILLRHHGLHVELRIDRTHPIGRADEAGISDLVVESAVSTIQDLEDSVAAVDADDKVAAYRNWLGLMRGTLEAQFQKGQRLLSRRLNPDRLYQAPTGGEFALPGRSLMLVRNVGHHMLSDMVRLEGAEVPETMIDAAVCALIALHDLRGAGPLRNSRSGSVYIVKPKLHGPEEVALAARLFSRVEELLGLDRNTLKMGIMDEERRTTLNLAECIRAARERVVFINTGFLDRTGDEIHTSMAAGPMLRKDEIRNAPWLEAYERQNVDIGLGCGFAGRAQIGKGMWAMPDLMAQMLATKIAHPRAGASTGCATGRARRWPSCWPCRSRRSRSGAPRRSSANSTIMPRGSSATWCAGWSWGSAVPRCPIRTTSRSWKIVPRCASRASTWRTGCTTACARARRRSRPCSAWPGSSTHRTPGSRGIGRWRRTLAAVWPSRRLANWCSRGGCRPTATRSGCCMHAAGKPRAARRDNLGPGLRGG